MRRSYPLPSSPQGSGRFAGHKMTPNTIKLIHRMFAEARGIEEIARATHKEEGLLLAWDQCPESYKDERIHAVRRTLAFASQESP